MAAAAVVLSIKPPGNKEAQRVCRKQITSLEDQTNTEHAAAAAAAAEGRDGRGGDERESGRVDSLEHCDVKTLTNNDSIKLKQELHLCTFVN